MYHILGFIAVILGIVFIWVVGSYDYKLGVYFAQVYAVVFLCFMTGLIMLAKRFHRKQNERESEKEEAGRYEEKKADFGRELFLFSNSEGDTISYRVENEEREVVFEAVGKLAKGRVDSLKLFAPKSDAGADIFIIREQGAKEYKVREGEQVIGSITMRKAGLSFAGADDRVDYAASFADENISEEEEAVAGIMTLVTLQTFSQAKANILLIRGSDDKVLGKYFFPLRNLDLVDDGGNLASRRIAVVLAIMADVKLQLQKQ